MVDEKEMWIVFVEGESHRGIAVERDFCSQGRGRGIEKCHVRKGDFGGFEMEALDDHDESKDALDPLEAFIELLYDRNANLGTESDGNTARLWMEGNVLVDILSRYASKSLWVENASFYHRHGFSTKGRKTSITDGQHIPRPSPILIHG